MRRKFNMGLSLALVMSMMIGTMPAGVLANINGKEEIAQNRTMEKNTEYAEGEAIILYDIAKAGTKSFSSQGELGTDIKIVETYDFDAEKSLKKASGNTIGSKGFAVSLVKSEKYTTEELIAKLKNNKNIQYVEPNYRIRTMDMEDPYTKYQWGLDNKGQNGGTAGLDINAQADILIQDADQEERVIALVDTGIDYEHEDLRDVVWNNPISSKTLKGLHGYDFISGDDDPMDDNGHGSHCSGIMAGKADNGVGISGVAVSDNVKIMALKILDAEGYGYGMEAVGAYNYIYKAQSEGINVVAVNNSWGAEGDEESDILNELINMVGENGAISVCAAGNASEDNDVTYTVPANYDSPYIISVAATNEKDELAAFSNYGKSSVDIAAPGTDILSTVNVDTFNPGLYENKDSLCQMFESFESGNIVQTINDNGYIEGANSDNAIPYGIHTNGGGAEISVDIADNIFFGEKEEGSASLVWSITGAEYGESYVLYLPYEAEVSSTALYSSVMVKASGPKGTGEDFFGLDMSTVIATDGTIDAQGRFNETGEKYLSGAYVDEGNYWNHFSGSVASSVKKNQTRAIAVYLTPGEAGDYIVYIDNAGVSAANVSSEEFGKYDFYNGTSMATPFVTGAVAAVANAYPEETAMQWKARILGSTRKTEELGEKTVTGGVLDLSKVENPNMSIELIEANDSTFIINGYYLDGAIVKINGEVVEPMEQDDLSIIMDASDYEDRYLEIELIKGEDVLYADYFVASGESFEYVNELEAMYDGGAVVSDGEKLYYINNSGNIYEGIPSKDSSLTWTDQESVYSLDMFGDIYSTVVDYEITNSTAAISSNKTIWTVLNLNVGYAEECILASYDSENGWSKAADIPDEITDLTGFTLASYNGVIYILGGFNTATGECSKAVYSFDMEREEWIEETQMPEGRCFAKAVQSDDTLVVTLGGNGQNEELPKNLIYDGKTWTVTNAGLENIYELNGYTGKNNSGELVEVTYYDANIGLVKEGIIYTNLKVEGVGDTFIYNVKEDAYVACDYSLSNSGIYGDTVLATTVGNSLYVLYGYSYVEEEYEYWKTKTEDIWDDLESILGGDFGFSDTSMVSVCRMPVESGAICVKDNSSVGGSVQGAGNYLPGDVMILSANARRNYFIQSFTVDGQKVEQNADGTYEWVAVADENGKVVDASVVAGAYVTSITMPETAELNQGESLELAVKVIPSNADNNGLVWTSDNASAVSVDNNGKITASLNAKEGTVVTIKAVAQDRKTVSATCIVTVKAAENNTNNSVNNSQSNSTTGSQNNANTAADNKAAAANTDKTVPVKGKTYTVGKLKYKVISNSASSKTVKCTGVTSKNVKKVTIPAKVTVNGYSFKVTSIGNNAFKNCRKLTKVTIGKNVKTVGKNIFKNCKKLKKITIKSKKLKKSVRKQLKNLAKANV